MRYKYCPECGRALIDKKAGDDGYIPYCEQCERFWFDYFGSCVIVLVANEYNEIALLQQNYMSTEYMSFVSGYICPGESAEETAMREVEEEIGIKLECLEYVGYCRQDFSGKTGKCYVCTVSTVFGEIRFSGDLKVTETFSKPACLTERRI